MRSLQGDAVHVMLISVRNPMIDTSSHTWRFSAGLLHSCAYINKAALLLRGQTTLTSTEH